MRMPSGAKRRSSRPRLGQHFLIRPEIAERIVRSAGIVAGDIVLEVGPGKGIITRELQKTGARVVAVEKDKKLAEGLGVIHGDILSCDIRADVIVANLPFYITGRFLRKFLGGGRQPRRMILILQREVAERIVAKDGKESILSISVKAYGTPKIVMHLKPGSFSPPPDVESSLVVIDEISKNFFKRVDEGRFFQIIRAGFAHKRKQARGNLRGVVSQEALDRCRVASGARAEDMQLIAWRCLAGGGYT